MSANNPLNSIRRTNVLHLIKYFKIDRHQLAERMGISYTQLNGYLRPTTPKGIGHKTVEKFEKAFNLNQGELNTDLSSAYPLSDNSDEPIKNLRPISTDGTVNEIINQEILVVPLFLTDIDNGELNPRKEPCIDKAFLKVSCVLEQGINPNHVKAIQFADKWPTPHKVTFFVDSSFTHVDPLNVWHYLVAIDGKRKIMSLDLSNITPNTTILGRAFYTEQPLLSRE